MRVMFLQRLDITHLHAQALDELPNHHRDPFDRMLIAQAVSEQMTLLTADPVFQKYRVDLIYCGNLSWGGRRGSNPRHSGPQTDARPAPLPPPSPALLSLTLFSPIR